MKAFTFAAATALLSTAYAATVSLEETPCIQNNTDLQKFDIEVGKLVPKDLKSVCGLKITAASGIDINAVECQAFRDVDGKESGSSKFTAKNPANIATNPVQEAAIQCNEVSPGTTTVVTVITSTPSVATGTAGTTGGAGSSGNATVPSVTGGPSTQPGGASGTQTAPGTPSGTGAAGKMGVSVAALAAGVAALVL